MKTTFALSVLFLLFSFLSPNAEAQTSESVVLEYPTKGSSEISISLGMNTSNLADGGFGPADNTNYFRSFAAAISYEQYLSKTWGIKARLNYDPKGFKTFFYDLKASYITIPVMANWHFGKKKRWYLQFGPYIGVKLSDSTSPTILNFEEIKPTDFGFDIGIGVKIPIGGQMFYIESDGQSPFSPQFDNDEDNTISRSMLSVGIVF